MRRPSEPISAFPRDTLRTMDRVRIGCVSYLNTVPMIEGLELLPEADLVKAVPAKLVSMLERDEVDVAIVSLIDAARASSPMGILPVGMIGSDGPTLTVRLFSQAPPEHITRVHADTDSHTSVAVCRLLPAEQFGIDAKIVDYDAREQMPTSPDEPIDAETANPWPEAMLLIGDKVVT